MRTLRDAFPARLLPRAIPPSVSRWRRGIVGAATLLAFALLIAQVGQGFAAYRAGQTTYGYFYEALSLETVPFDFVTWREEIWLDDAVTDTLLTRGADFTVYDGNSVGARLSEGWRAFTLALQSGETAALGDVFSGPALSRAQAAVEGAVGAGSAAGGGTDSAAGSGTGSGAQMVTLQLSAAPQFFHLDRSLIQIEAQSLIARFRLVDGQLANYTLARDQTLTTLRGESTGWHIYAHERQRTDRLDTSGIGNRARIAATGAQGPYQGLNYYPAASPWRAFWEAFDPEIIAADMALMADLGANSVRIFIPLAPFLADAEARLAQLETFVQLADAAGLSLVPTLFDLKGSYAPHTWPQDWAYLSAVLRTLQAHDNIAFIDMKNEPDLDQNYVDPALVQAWLRTMVGLARDQAPEFAYTVGWSSAQAVQLIDLVDVVTYHDYASLRGTAARLAAVQARANGKPVVITEIGETSWRGIPLFAGSSPAYQARSLETRLAALSGSADFVGVQGVQGAQGAQGAQGVFVWTLHDFENLDSSAIGGSFINKNRQRRFGLFNSAGQAKPAAAIVRKAFSPTP